MSAELSEAKATIVSLRSRVLALESIVLRTTFSTLPKLLINDLSPQEECFLSGLYSCDVLTRTKATVLLWAEDQKIPQPKIFDVVVCKLRPKLRAFGIEFDTIRARGWSLTDEGRRIIDALKKKEHGGASR